MLRTSKLLTLVAGASLALSAFAGTAGAAGPADNPVDDIQNNPCAGNPDLPVCQGDPDPDDDGPTVDQPDLDWCFSIAPEEDCASTDDEDPGEEPEGGGEVPTADPADAVSGSPNFTG